MKKLIPEWCKHYDEFWESVKKRNLFFIRLRYFAVLSLFSFVASSEYIFHLKLLPVQKNVLTVIAVFLLIYNLLIQKFRNKFVTAQKFTPIHLSVLQITVDLILLTVIVYFTGGIESPFLPFFIFHMIIGSLILPACMIYFASFLVVVIISAIVITEYQGILSHYCIFGLFDVELFNRYSFVSITLITFAVTVFFSVFIANKIARQLYLQEEHLMKALEELKGTNIRKHKYITGIMHEIKSPVSASQSIVEMILEGYAGEVPEAILERLKKIGKRNAEAIEMINDILKISKINLLEEKNAEETDIIELVKNEIEKFREIAERKNIIINDLSIIGKPRKIKADKKVIALAVSNILGNSVKYTPDNGKIEIGIKFDKSYVEIKICDNGKGIPKEELNKIFEPFYRLKRDKGKIEGSGIGLALVKDIVEKHNGEIVLESPSNIGTEENPGTCCIIRFPYSLKEKFIEEKVI